MPYNDYTTEEIGRRGQTLYDQKIRDKVEAKHHGQFLVLDTMTEWAQWILWPEHRKGRRGTDPCLKEFRSPDRNVLNALLLDDPLSSLDGTMQ